MLSLDYNVSERCYLEAAKRTLGAANDKELYERIDLRYSYGEVGSEEFRTHYNSDFWQLRKVSWILSVPLRLIAAIAAVAEAAIGSLVGDRFSSANFFSAARLCEYALGDLICVFNDEKGQHWITDAYVHLRLYLLAQQSDDLKPAAFRAWFVPPLEALHENLQSLRATTATYTLGLDRVV